MPNVSRILLFCVALCLWPAISGAQQLSASPTNMLLAPRPPLRSPGLVKAWATELRRAWLASGNPAPDRTAAPVIVSGKILAASVNVAMAPGQPSISVKYDAPAGAGAIIATFCTSATATQCIQLGGFPFGNPKSGSITIENFDGVDSHLNLYSAPGVWTLTDLEIVDEAGVSTDYNTAAQIKALIPKPTFTVVNSGAPDTVPPAVSAGKILTPVATDIEEQGYFAAQLTVSDNLSGAYYVFMYLDPPDGTDNVPVIVTGNDGAAPVKSGGFSFSGLFAADVPATETWTISGYTICDLANNCATDTNSSDILALFGTTTFKVKP